MKIRFLFFALLFSFLTVNTTHATPFLYTFEGEVQLFNINVDPNNTSPFFTTSYSIDGMQFNAFDQITYSLVVDLDEPGFCSPAGSSQCNFPGGIPIDETNSDYFYVGLETASMKIPVDWFNTDLSYGLKLSNNTGDVFQTTLNAGSSISIKTSDFFLFPPASDISKDITLWDSLDIPLVSGLLGLDKWDGFYDGEYYSGTMYSLLDLVSIEPIATVSEPSTLLLMLLALFYIARRRSCNIMNTFHFRA